MDLVILFLIYVDGKRSQCLKPSSTLGFSTNEATSPQKKTMIDSLNPQQSN